MAEYIDKGLALATACSGLTREIEGERWIRVDEVRASLKAAPTIEAEPTKHGHWIYKWHGMFHRDLPICSECKNFVVYETKYCPNCGAKMDEEDQ